jgi:hypothetical protein
MEDEMQEYWLALAIVMAVATAILVPISYFLGRLSMREPPDLRRFFQFRRSGGPSRLASVQTDVMAANTIVAKQVTGTQSILARNPACAGMAMIVRVDRRMTA